MEAFIKPHNVFYQYQIDDNEVILTFITEQQEQQEILFSVLEGVEDLYYMKYKYKI